MFIHIKIAKYQNSEKLYITKNYKIHQLKKKIKNYKTIKKEPFNGATKKIIKLLKNIASCWF